MAESPSSIPHPTPEPNRLPFSPLEEKILRAVREVKYGSIEITLHDGRVVQVERREKERITGSS
jgi:hypothetical protein